MVRNNSVATSISSRWYVCWLFWLCTLEERGSWIGEMGGSYFSFLPVAFSIVAMSVFPTLYTCGGVLLHCFVSSLPVCLPASKKARKYFVWVVQSVALVLARSFSNIVFKGKIKNQMANENSVLTFFRKWLMPLIFLCHLIFSSKI